MPCPAAARTPSIRRELRLRALRRDLNHVRAVLLVLLDVRNDLLNRLVNLLDFEVTLEQNACFLSFEWSDFVAKTPFPPEGKLSFWAFFDSRTPSPPKSVKVESA